MKTIFFLANKDFTRLTCHERTLIYIFVFLKFKAQYTGSTFHNDRNGETGLLLLLPLNLLLSIFVNVAWHDGPFLWLSKKSSKAGSEEASCISHC